MVRLFKMILEYFLKFQIKLKVIKTVSKLLMSKAIFFIELQ